MENELKTAKIISTLLDNKFHFLGINFGINAFFEIVPGLGDTVAAILSFYIIYLASKSKISSTIVAKMIFNVFLTYIVGLIPFIGDAFYIFFKPNIRNYKLLADNSGKALIPERIVSM